MVTFKEREQKQILGRAKFCFYVIACTFKKNLYKLQEITENGENKWHQVTDSRGKRKQGLRLINAVEE